MERKNYIVKLKMTKEELLCFRNLEPLFNLSMTPNESNLISRLLGYKDSHDLTKKGYKSNRFLRQAFQVLSFLYLTKEDSGTFVDFWDRLIFTDKEVENKVRRTFNIVDSRETLSSSQLALMWLLNTEKDELDGLDSDNE